MRPATNNLPLTTRQQEIVRFIGNFAAANGYPPTRAEIAAEFKFASPNAAEEHLQALARKGVLTVKPRTARSIVLTGHIPEAAA